MRTVISCLAILLPGPRAQDELLAPRPGLARHRTRTFMLHLRDRLGEWQDAVEVTGPCAGAAGVPQSLDHCYVTAYLRAPHSHLYDCHLAPQD